MIDAGTASVWLGIFVTVGGAVAAAVRFAFWVFDEWQKRRGHAGFVPPKRTLSVATQQEGHCWWAMGRRGEDPTMQVVGRMLVTNTSTVDVRIPKVELRHAFLGRKRVVGMVTVARSRRDNLHGMFDIPPNETTHLSCDFWIYPPVVEPPKPFKARAIIFYDQFGNAHKVRGVTFESMAARSKPPIKQPREHPHDVTDRVEKEIVSVLLAEIARYEMCGRSVGGLGSVHLMYEGRTFTGVGTDSWHPDSPVNQLIVSNPHDARLCSDNLKALLAFYERLADDERARFVNAVLARVNPDDGYLRVSYFMVCVLWQVGRLKDALRVTRDRLPTGEQREFGLSNVLMLLNGLLRYRHPDFSDDMLDDVGRLIKGLDEHPFMIPQKVAAIRTLRLGQAERA